MTIHTPISRTPAISRTERYVVRVQGYLTALPDDAARFEFLTGEMAKWEERRDAFIRKIDAGGDGGDVTIFDYQETISALEIEQAKVSPLKAVREELNAGAAEMKAGVERVEKVARG